MRPLADLLVCLRFFSRLPLPALGLENEERGLSAAVMMVPVAGLMIGLGPALVLAMATALGLPSLLTAALAVVTLVAITGALHEDGLADCADGFGGGQTVARKLEIMRDSRIGTFGACALILSLLSRVAAVGAVTNRSIVQGAAAILLAAMVSRVACLLPLIALPPARPDGLGVSTGRPQTSHTLLAVAIMAGLGLALAPLGLGVLRIIAALAFAILGASLATWLARRQINGQTGDVAGAAQQIAEIAALLALAAAA